MPAPSPSPETKKRWDAVFEKDLAEITSESDEYDPTSKTQEQLDAMIAKYHRDVKTSRMEANRRCKLLEGINAACPVCHVHVPSDCGRYTEASQAVQRNAVQRRQMERARDRAVEDRGGSCPLPHLCSYSICSAFAAADPAEHVPGGYLHYYNDNDDNVCSTGTSSEGNRIHSILRSTQTKRTECPGTMNT